VRSSRPRDWWKLPVIDDDFTEVSLQSVAVSWLGKSAFTQRPTLRVVWAAGLDCKRLEAQNAGHAPRLYLPTLLAPKRFIRCRASDTLSSTSNGTFGHERKARVLAWLATGVRHALFRPFRHLNLTLVQLSAAGLSIGLGARREFGRLISRFSKNVYLCDPERRVGPREHSYE